MKGDCRCFIVSVQLVEYYFGELQAACVLGVLRNTLCARDPASSFFQEQLATTFSPSTQVRSLRSWY